MNRGSIGGDRLYFIFCKPKMILAESETR
jgi:hypothetical protein